MVKILKKTEDAIKGLLSKDQTHEQSTSVTVELKDSTAHIENLVGGNYIQNIYNLPPDFVESLALQIARHFQIPERHSTTLSSDSMSSSEIQEVINTAEDFQKHHKFDNALHLYLSLTTNPKMIDKISHDSLFIININAAICYLNLYDIEHRLDKALYHLNTAEQIPTVQKEKLYLVRAWYYHEMRSHQNTFENAKMAISLKPNYIKAINIAAISSELLGQSVESVLKTFYLNDSNALKDIFTQDASALFTIGQLFVADEDIDHAIEYLSHSERLATSECLPKAMLGNAYLMKAFGGKDFLKDININTDVDLPCMLTAIRYYDEAFTLAKNLCQESAIKTFLVNSALAHFVLGRHNVAYEQINRAITSGLEDEDILTRKARIEVALGDLKEARSLSEKWHLEPFSANMAPLWKRHSNLVTGNKCCCSPLR